MVGMTERGRGDGNGAGRGLLLIAAREPTPGKTKTRLGTTIGMERAAALHAAFLVDLAARFTPAVREDWGFDFGWAHTPEVDDFSAILARIGCPHPPETVCFVPQSGDGWDVRQANLLRWGWEHGYGQTVLIASDSPHLPRSVVQVAFAVLEGGDLALGRTLDGGYYLIGMRGFHDVLTGIPMSTASAADALVARASDRGLRIAELPPTFDIDTEEDLEHLRAALAPDGKAAPATWAAMQELGLAAVPQHSAALKT
jgi:glycosyltransferase A (GT-A) superfamily protein (DUF2064 family)